MDVLELKDFEENVTNLGMHCPSVKQILASWAIKNIIRQGYGNRSMRT